MPKEIINMNLERPNNSVKWGFNIIGGKDQALTLKVGKIKAFSPAEAAGLKIFDYIYTINGKEVFEMSHNECVAEVKKASTMLSLAIERGDHIVPNFEEIWPSGRRKKGAKGQGNIDWDYYTDAMENGPQLSGHLPIPKNFTTVGKPQICVNQYDNPIEVYSDETIEEMKDERLVMTNPEFANRIAQHKETTKPKMSDNPLAAQAARKFDSTKSNVIGMLGDDKASRGN